MRRYAKYLLLLVVFAPGCLPESCNDDCNQDGDPDCRADIVNRPTSLPPSPPAPLTLQCRSLNSRPELELEWQLGIGGGTPPFSYTLDFGDQTPLHTGSWPGVGSDPRGFHEYERGGDFQVAGQVRDAAGQTRACALAYAAPDADLRLRCSATPLTGTAPLSVSFDVTSREGCIGPCTVTWYFGDGETFQGGHAVHTYEFPGPTAQSTYAAFAELRDSTDRVDQCRRPIQVLPGTGDPQYPTNHPPTIVSATANPSSITAGQSTTISGTTSDPDPGDTVTWQLTFDTPGAGSLSSTSGTGPILSTYTSSPTIQGTVSIRVTAVDSFGAPAPYASVHVQVASNPVNQPPVIVSLTASPSFVFPGGPPSQIAATITDPNGDPVTWTLALDPSSTATGTFSATSGSGNASATFSAAPPPNQGTAVIRLTAQDPGGLTATRTVNVNVSLGKN